MIYLSTREILQNMDIFQNILKNVINDLYIVFSKQLCIVNIRCYKTEQLKLHRSLLGVKGGGGRQKQPSEVLNSPLSNIYL